MLFQWKKEYETHLPQIDAQHLELVHLGAQLESILSHSNRDVYDELVDAIAGLKAYTVYHFASEEQLLELHNYPNLEAHKEEHNHFIAQLEAIDLTTLDHNQQQAAKELVRFVSKWIFSHILGADSDYKLFFKDLGMTSVS